MSDAPREPGFYWVRNTGGWSMAEWAYDVWWRAADPYEYSDEAFSEIGPKIEPPTP